MTKGNSREDTKEEEDYKVVRRKSCGEARAPSMVCMSIRGEDENTADVILQTVLKNDRKVRELVSAWDNANK